jgi:nucleoside-diphosphate-sugar epimerase
MTAVVITGAAGNLGGKLRAHLESLGESELRLLDLNPRGDPAIERADLSRPDDGWASRFAGADVVVHLAANASSEASWAELAPANIDAVLNVYQAAARHGVPRVVFASSVWTMAGRVADGAAISEAEADPGDNRYGATKLFGEQVGRAYARTAGISTVALRIGACRPADNAPIPAPNRWEDEAWISNRDLCHGFERAMTAPVAGGFCVAYLTSANPNSRWSLTAAREVLGYTPRDSYTPPPRDAAVEKPAWRLPKSWLTRRGRDRMDPTPESE